MQENRWKAVGITWGISAGLLLLEIFTFLAIGETSGFFSGLSWLAALLGGIFLDMAIAWEFYEIAEKKGHFEKRYWWLAFCLTMIGYLIVIALPDRGSAAPRTYAAPQQTYSAPQQTYGAPQQTYTAPQPSYNDLPEL